MNPLGIALTRILEAKGLTDADFARKTGLSKGLLSQIKRRPPPTLSKKVDVKKWAHLLNLRAEEAAALLEAAELSISSARIQQLVAELRKGRR